MKLLLQTRVTSLSSLYKQLPRNGSVESRQRIYVLTRSV